ncbi:electron transport complex subunit RsxD [Saccharobesus litoralis]|uniref:Ion-translocating oxidoreductase complex subunit D n=1 Tax=Saccharobesus litoralis TaxID=2172099 RepID=A0A2S0VUG6_9ALTE|nr:electron transport complex subunit RsxD [Saccharobesus litoralis]AWB67866.1 electron transport complex subunit RsxD [Saccharobesus litoralis]
MSFKLASSPHTRRANKTANIMRWVALACIPGVITQWYCFGIGVLIQIFICIISAIVAEAICCQLRGRPVKQVINDHSALLTGLLLGICLPPLAPWWIGVIGSVFAITLVKQAYGGLGQNLFNPAMAGYVILLISFPVSMTGWIPPTDLITIPLSFSDYVSVVFSGYTAQGYSLEQIRSGIDGVTMATPLESVRNGLNQGLTYQEIIKQDVFSNGLGQGWFAVNIAFLLGGVVLLKQKIIKWQIPLSFLISLAIFSLISQAISPDGTGSMLLHMTSGATCFAAFFILTDPVSASTTDKGRLIFGALCGFLVFVIRQFGGYPDAVAFAVLLANMAVPLIDYYTQPRTFGHGSRS